VQLSESEESENSNRSWVEFIDTSNSNNEGKSWFSGDKDLTGEFGLSSGVDFGFLVGLVLSFVLLSSLGDLLSSGFVGGSSLLSLLLKSSGDFLISLLFFSESFRFGSYLFLSCHYHKIKIINNELRKINKDYYHLSPFILYFIFHTCKLHPLKSSLCLFIL